MWPIDPSHIQFVEALGGGVGIAAVLGGFAALFHRQTQSNRKTDAMMAELKPDHGNSLKDKVDAIDRSMALLNANMENMAHSSERIHGLLVDKMAAHDREFKQVHHDLSKLAEDLEKTIDES